MTLENVMKEIRKQFGEMSILKLGDEARRDVEAVSTGALGLDLALGVGGLPKGTAAFIDAEHALDPGYAKKIGVDLAGLVVSQPSSGEEALTICEELVKSGAVDIVVVDSVAALTPQAEIDGAMGDSHVGLQARLMSQAMRKLTAAIAQTKTLCIFTNQVREKIGVMFGNPETTPGGKALKFYASCRLQVQRIGAIKSPAGGKGREEQGRLAVYRGRVRHPLFVRHFVGGLRP